MPTRCAAPISATQRLFALTIARLPIFRSNADTIPKRFIVAATALSPRHFLSVLSYILFTNSNTFKNTNMSQIYLIHVDQSYKITNVIKITRLLAYKNHRSGSVIRPSSFSMARRRNPYLTFVFADLPHDRSHLSTSVSRSPPLTRGCRR